MIVVTEALSAAALDFELAFHAVQQAFMAATALESVSFPPLNARNIVPENQLSIKAGACPELVGLCIHSSWPENNVHGLERHGAAVILMNNRTGRLEAVIEGTRLGALRTAAADAVAASALARADSRVLAIFGAGRQAEHECLALAAIRQIDTILVVARDRGRGDAFVQKLRRHNLAAELSDARAACAAADIIVTATPSRAPLFQPQWIRPGTHIACMGADAPGKQELPAALLHKADLFCDLPEQSVRIGEFQHVAEAVRHGAVQLTAIGHVISGKARGRVSREAITIFDSSGLALQDLHVARALVERLKERRSSGETGQPELQPVAPPPGRVQISRAGKPG